jgi:hypothetical protein
MVEFPLVVWRTLKGLRRQFEIYPRLPAFADINFASSNRYLHPGWYVGN